MLRLVEQVFTRSSLALILGVGVQVNVIAQCAFRLEELKSKHLKTL
jgi:hypothetical protein